jgi:hypothetical protein
VPLYDDYQAKAAQLAYAIIKYKVTAAESGCTTFIQIPSSIGPQILSPWAG